MYRKEKAKWFLFGLGVGWTSLIILVVVILVILGIDNRADRYDPFGGVRPDMGESLYEFGRPALWSATHMPLGDSGFTAGAGPVRYEDEDDLDWDYYSIEIEKPVGKSRYVFFGRDFRIDGIPAELVDKKVADIVTFDEDTRVVTFTLGINIHTYKLPDR